MTDQLTSKNLLDQVRMVAHDAPINGEYIWGDICRKAADEIERLQAEIDALMLEFCPGRMTTTQLAEWARHQRPAHEPSVTRAEIQRWRDDGFEAAAKICERYGQNEPAQDIRALIRGPVEPAVTPDPVYCTTCGQEDRDCYCDPSQPAVETPAALVKVHTSAMLSCPFCGCDDLETSPFPANREKTEWCCRCGNPDCNAELLAPTKEEAARRWNRTAEGRDAAYVYRDRASLSEPGSLL